jgi:hypothetical protein
MTRLPGLGSAQPFPKDEAPQARDDPGGGGEGSNG